MFCKPALVWTLRFIRRLPAGMFPKAFVRIIPAVFLVVTLLEPAEVFGQPNEADAEQAAGRTVAELFADFLHFSILGRFDLAESYAVELLNHPDLDPVEILRLSEEHERSIDTLTILVGHSTLGESAARILDLIHKGEHLLRKDVDRIRANIEKLGGPPQMEYNAIRALADSGEYAIPWLIQALHDKEKRELWPRIIRALPQMGKPAVRPLVQALEIDEEKIRRIVIDTLGALGYAHAVPYLLAVAIDEDVLAENRRAAVTAVVYIEQRSGRRFSESAPVEFVALGEKYYDEVGADRADPRLAEANVWSWNEQTEFLDFTPVPREIFGPVMSMRCCERALLLEPAHEEAVSLWLAANIRRESRLGMNVESGDPDEPGDIDPTRPDSFPRALYFTSAAGPRYAHRVLSRAADDLDAPVMLGAIAALRRVAGPSSLIGSEAYKQPFVDALTFPDLVVRTRTALALGNALPRSPFRGMELVIPTLADAVSLTGRRHVLVIEPDDNRLNRLVADLRDPDTVVSSHTNAFEGLDQALASYPTVDALFLASDVKDPDLAQVIAAVRTRYELALTPIVLLAKRDDVSLVQQLAEGNRGIGQVDADAGRDLLLSRLNEVASKVGRTPVGPDLARELALLATETLLTIAVDDRTVFDPARAEKACIAAIDSGDQELQIAAMDVLALLPGAAAQKAITATALSAETPEPLRLEAFTDLAESAKRFGNQLGSEQVDQLLDLAMNEQNLRLRTAGSRALGALNIAPGRVSRILMKYHHE